MPSPFTLLTNGLGSISPNLGGTYLEIGRAYTLKVKPGSGQVFAGWDMGVNSTAPVLTFLMQPNLTLRANFIPNPYIPAMGTYNGLFYQASGVTHDTSGFFTLKLTSKGVYSGKLYIGGGRYSFTGAVWVDGTSTTVVVRKGLPNLTLNLLVDLANGADRVLGSVTGGGLNANLTGDRLVFDARTLPAPQAGKYTLALLHRAMDRKFRRVTARGR